MPSPTGTLVAPVAPVAVPAPSPTAQPATPPRQAFAPKDECAALPGFAAFREALFAAIRTRDGDGLAKLADPAVRLDFGGGAGPDELRRRLATTRPELWDELDSIVRLGCAADGGVATMPWVFSRWPDSVDPYAGRLVLGTSVPLRRRPAPAAPERERLDWALVSLAGDGFDPKAPYTEVTAPGGARGFVETARLRSLLDYRIIADRIDGEWRITALIAGD
ncbi:MAG: hypothetical protein ABW194_01805 [Novosphingobium sp.]